MNDQLAKVGWPQKITAEKLDLTQPRVSDLCTETISKFSLDALVNIRIKLGIHLRVENTENREALRTDRSVEPLSFDPRVYRIVWGAFSNTRM
ncbi:XRE family transcriptional regulator [Corynebacterium sp. A21]|uniref:XRE family transcriptional regulator n=1 Tax=Corynebacterium sp. A21 TaxID=3457318 RepID=UPI003FCFBCC7